MCKLSLRCDKGILLVATVKIMKSLPITGRIEKQIKKEYGELWN